MGIYSIDFSDEKFLKRGLAALKKHWSQFLVKLIKHNKNSQLVNSFIQHDGTEGCLSSAKRE